MDGVYRNLCENSGDVALIHLFSLSADDLNEFVGFVVLDG